MLKQHVNLDQIYAFAKSKENIIKLAKATRNDYDGMIKGTILFDKVDSRVAVMQIFTTISKDYTVGKMIEILQDKEIKVIIDNCTPASVKDVKNNKEYCEMELCDALWKIVIDNI